MTIDLKQIRTQQKVGYPIGPAGQAVHRPIPMPRVGYQEPTPMYGPGEGPTRSLKRHPPTPPIMKKMPSPTIPPVGTPWSVPPLHGGPGTSIRWQHPYEGRVPKGSAEFQGAYNNARLHLQEMKTSGIVSPYAQVGVRYQNGYTYFYIYENTGVPL